MHKALGYESLGDIVHDQTFLKVTGVGPDFFLKMESLNPAGSIKLKTAVGLVNDVQARGLLGPQTTLIESSSGNLGVALAMICAERGIPFTCVVDPNSSSHNIRMMRSFGAQVIQVEIPDANGGFLGTRIALIREKVASDPRYVWLNQYENAANPRAHARTTAHSISRHFGHVDYLFVGAGTTGTLMGCLQHFQRHHPTTKIIAVDSVGSVTFGTPASRRFIPGLGTSQRPPIFNADGIHALEMVPEAHAVAMCRILARSKGMLVGGSTATVIAAVHAWRERIEPGAVVVALSPDWGERYLDTLYDDQWVEQRFGREVLSMTLADLSNSKNTPLCGRELARESGGSVMASSRASSFPQRVRSSDETEAERLTQAAFHVVDGEVTARLLAADPLACIDDVQAAYLAHEAGRTVNPDSYFLRFPEAPANRIIALPASLAGDQPVSGIKWISSFPGNVDTGLQRASAVLILNDPVTGYAFACLEASRISAMRTAASAVLGARWMNRQQRHVRQMAFIGAGFIARTILDMFVSDGWAMDSVSVFDQHEDSALALISHAAGRHRLNGEQTDLHDCLQADVVVFATTAPSPYVLAPVFRPGQVVLNISLRDLGPEVIAQTNNILDDVEHCLKAQTSPDLAVRQYQHRSFITGTLAQLMTGEVELSPDRASIFSPFGLGVLDLAVGQRVYRQALAEGSALPVPRFFFESNRW
ncbi:Pyridoxal-5'-phosphate-dependent enzyme, beta subunit:ornithine cyclodeaminase/mu-crystallin [Pseudomonas syringae pv. delphinii]|uniref:cysteine synthase n=1 Tax=Pseudomonas syringae pv. delphinii TaxID=192088 RepID=A0A0P9P1G1_9PSED|nr:2,3-diaminopropionate biosynthesis protein SbnA [Pseudomonas syringae group genomosp. 3]KPX13065.1 Pyridoxal-phosphate dependent enzyme family/ornithine cyclodeaminase family protein [Pseudomonas syringae pv. delphinii]RMP11939.1 Pyridoxal-phosphate dependent enzyme family/ornithine cyclodeaminase protein [Pseudomonas syringae pv. delphinii]RMP24713.1 Pyridoxal-phosphate dependent enzyme family/ornithine cyclodeaminase protein [Pseudomonas syringae pv. delphinii]RMQ17590.1 Pyridoxal-5'-phosp